MHTFDLAISSTFFAVKVLRGCVQPRESKLRTEDNAQAHKSSPEFEIAALL